MSSEDATGVAGIGISTPGNASLLGWAMSSLTLKGKPSEQAPVATANASMKISSSVSTPNLGAVTATGTTMGHTSSSIDLSELPAPVSPTSTDGWGEIENGVQDDHESEKDGWDDIEPLEEPKSSPALANIQAVQKRPVSVSKLASQTKPPVTSIKPKTMSTAANEEDDDLWGSIAAPAPRISSKPFNVKPAASSAIEADDPWAAIAAPPPTTSVKPLSAGRGRSKPTAPKLGAQRINRTSSGT